MGRFQDPSYIRIQPLPLPDPLGNSVEQNSLANSLSLGFSQLTQMSPLVFLLYNSQKCVHIISFVSFLESYFKSCDFTTAEFTERVKIKACAQPLTIMILQHIIRTSALQLLFLCVSQTQTTSAYQNPKAENRRGQRQNFLLY